MPIFCVNDTEFEFTGDQTMLDVKKHIINELTLPCPYIDLTFVMEKPMRVLGKFNVEPGKVPRPLDSKCLDEFAFRDKVTLTVTEITDYDPNKPRVPFVSGGRGRGRGLGRGRLLQGSTRETSLFDHSSTQESMTVEPTFDLSSTDDFPSLGK